MAARREWTGPARTMAVGIDDAVTACRAGSADGFAAALAGLARVDREQLSVVLGTLARDLMERAHPDGLDADAAEQVLQRCIRSAAAWYAGLDSDALIRALTESLGIGPSDDDESPQPAPQLVISHGLLLVADLLDVLGQPLRDALDAALAELMRAQTVEMP